MADSHKRRRQAGAAKQPSDPQRAQPLTCGRPSRTGSQQQDERDFNGAAPPESAGKCPDTEPPQAVPQREEDRGQKADEEREQQDRPAEVQQDADDDSDDSDVSETYEDEELDEEEDEEDEEELSSDQSNFGDFRCSVCDLQLPSKFKLQDHMNLHTGARPYCCAECGKRFCQIFNYRVHLRTHAKAKVERLWCRICLTGFGTQEQLKRHLSKTHLEDEFYECDLCKRVFTSLKDCENHVLLHKCMVNIACDVCGRNFRSEKSLARHKKRRCLRNFKCTDCSETFAKKNALLKHSFSHLGLLPYTCIRCRCHFRLAKLYRKHKCEPQRIHCVACLREFLSQDDFQQHKKDTGCWGNQEPNQKTNEIRCLECGQRFETSEELKKHAGAHQRVLKCAECRKGFRSALLLMSHMGGHAGQSPCFCQSCGLGFPYQQNYDSHLKTCGQTPEPPSALKKRQTSKSSLPERRPPKRPKPGSTSTADVSDRQVSTSPAAPGRDSCSPGSGTESVSAGSAQSEGLWTLTLDEKPSPSVNLVLFVPVCPSGELPLPPAVHQGLQVAAVQALSPSPLSSNKGLGVNATVGLPLSAPFELLTGFKGGEEAPLDLSRKNDSPKSALSGSRLVAVKSETSNFEVSGQNGSEKQEVKRHESDGESGTRRCKTEPAAPSPPSARSAPPELTAADLMKAPRSPGPGFDLWSSTCSQLNRCGAEKKIKMEVNI